jgi:hypothetical protein
MMSTQLKTWFYSTIAIGYLVKDGVGGVILVPYIQQFLHPLSPNICLSFCFPSSSYKVQGKYEKLNIILLWVKVQWTDVNFSQWAIADFFCKPPGRFCEPPRASQTVGWEQLYYSNTSQNEIFMTSVSACSKFWISSNCVHWFWSWNIYADGWILYYTSIPCTLCTKKVKTTWVNTVLYNMYRKYI